MRVSLRLRSALIIAAIVASCATCAVPARAGCAYDSNGVGYGDCSAHSVGASSRPRPVTSQSNGTYAAFNRQNALARQAQANHDYAAAISYYETALQYYPNDVTRANLADARGALAYAQGDYATALSFFQAAVDKDPGFKPFQDDVRETRALIENAQGYDAYRRGDLTAALAFYQRAAADSPNAKSYRDNVAAVLAAKASAEAAAADAARLAQAKVTAAAAASASIAELRAHLDTSASAAPPPNPAANARAVAANVRARELLSGSAGTSPFGVRVSDPQFLTPVKVIPAGNDTNALRALESAAATSGTYKTIADENGSTLARVGIDTSGTAVGAAGVLPAVTPQTPPGTPVLTEAQSADLQRRLDANKPYHDLVVAHAEAVTVADAAQHHLDDLTASLQSAPDSAKPALLVQLSDATLERDRTKGAVAVNELQQNAVVKDTVYNYILLPAAKPAH